MLAPNFVIALAPACCCSFDLVCRLAFFCFLSSSFRQGSIHYHYSIFEAVTRILEASKVVWVHAWPARFRTALTLVIFFFLACQLAGHCLCPKRLINTGPRGYVGTASVTGKRGKRGGPEGHSNRSPQPVIFGPESTRFPGQPTKEDPPAPRKLNQPIQRRLLPVPACRSLSFGT